MDIKMKITKITAAIVSILTLSTHVAHATNILNASTMSQGYSGSDINQVLSLTGNETMTEVKSLNLLNGLTKVRFQQEYKGVPIFGYNLSATKAPMGLLTDVSGQFLNLDAHELSVIPALSATAVLNMALRNDNTSKASVYNNQNDMFI